MASFGAGKCFWRLTVGRHAAYLCTGVVLGLAVLAVGAAQPGGKTIGSADQNRGIGQPSADEFEVYEVEAPKAWWKEPGRVGRLIGGVVIRQGDTVIRVQEAEYNQEASTATAAGGVTITDPEAQITADRLSVDMKAKKAVLEGAVRAVIKPKRREANGGTSEKGLRQKLREETVITCSRLEYWYKQKRAVVDGGLKLVQGERQFSAQRCLYFHKERTALLTGGVEGVDEKGQSYKADVIKLVLKEDDESVEAEGFHGTFKVKSAEGEQGVPQEPVQ